MGGYDFSKFFRAIRKRHCFKQTEMAKNLGISQPKYSKLENGLKPDIETWDRLCELSKISVRSYKRDYIDHEPKPVCYREQCETFDFKVPKQYVERCGSTARSFAPYLNFARRQLGSDLFYRYFSEKGIDLDYFVYMDAQFNADLIFELIESVDSVTHTKIENFSDSVVLESSHGLKYLDLKKYPSFDEFVFHIAEDRKFYDCNFAYEVLDFFEGGFEFLVIPEEHLEKSLDLSRCERFKKMLGQYVVGITKHLFVPSGLKGITIRSIKGVEKWKYQFSVEIR